MYYVLIQVNVGIVSALKDENVNLNIKKIAHTEKSFNLHVSALKQGLISLVLCKRIEYLFQS